MQRDESHPFVGTLTVLPVSSIEESTAWFRRALGFETVYLHEGDEPGEATNYAILRRGQVHVHLILDEPAPHRPAWTRAGTGYLYLLVRNVEQVFAETTSAGIGVARGLEVENWGARGFNLVDPSGNAIHVEQVQEP